MPLPSPITDGSVLSATFINQIIEFAAAQWERVQQVNVARTLPTLTAGDGDEEELVLTLTHKWKTLEYEIAMSQGTFDDLMIQYNTTTVFSDTNDRANPYVYAGTVNLTPFGLTVGQSYTIRVSVGGEPGSAVNSAVVRKLQEIPG